MRTRKFVGILVLLALAMPASPAHAGGVVTICDAAHLLTALAGGGTVTFSCSGTITLTAEIVISAETTIDGSGQTVAISGNHAVRVFTVNSGATLNLNELTVADGSALNYSGGGGILSYGTVTVSNSTFSGHSAPSGYSGGGILNSQGTLTVTNSTFSGSSGYYGGGIYNLSGTVSVSGSTFAGNEANHGGGIYNQGAMTVSSSTFSDNQGGGIQNVNGTLAVSNCAFSGNSGGGIHTDGSRAQVTVNDVIFSSNTDSHGGGIYIDDGMVVVIHSTLSGNSADYGAGIYNRAAALEVHDSTFYDNTGDRGGAIYNEGALTVSNSVFSGNDTDCPYFDPCYGGGIYNYDGAVIVSSNTFSGNSATNQGGGIYSDGNRARMTVSNSTFSGNSADGFGGGISIRGSLKGGALTLSNSTFSDNSAAGPYGYGGAIYIWIGSVTVSNSTFSSNSANRGGGIYSDGRATLKNTIIANSPTGNNCFGTIIDGGGNLSYPDTTCPGISANPLLGPLQNNDGSTETMALGPGSAAIDAGDDATCAASPVANLDQRGVTRPQGPHCDIGAYERQIFGMWFPLANAQ